MIYGSNLWYSFQCDNLTHVTQVSGSSALMDRKKIQQGNVCLHTSIFHILISLVIDTRFAWTGTKYKIISNKLKQTYLIVANKQLNPGALDYYPAFTTFKLN